ncbi:MAG: hypothetical protein Q4C70_08140, partial [Planctomycetia bacterium]|nr:hypothetical protein [Planctomycetia bacterium]
MKKCFAMSFLVILGVLCTWNLAVAATGFQPRESLARSSAESPLSVVAERQIGENVSDEVITDADTNMENASANRVSESSMREANITENNITETNVTENNITENVRSSNEIVEDVDSVYQDGNTTDMKDNTLCDDNTMNSDYG